MNETLNSAIIVRIQGTKLRNVANVNTIIHGIILRETRESARSQQMDLEWTRAVIS